MVQYLLFTDDYPFSADFDQLEFAADDRVILVSRRPDFVVNASQRARIDLVVRVHGFTEAELIEAIDRELVVEAGAVALSHDDFIYPGVAAVVRHYGMRGMTADGIAPFLDKAVAKYLLWLEQVPFPRFHLLDRRTGKLTLPGSEMPCTVSNLSFPIFVKPLQGAGAEHACKIDNLDTFTAWLQSASPPDYFEADEFIDNATLFHCEVLIEGARITAFQVCEYCNPCADFAGGRPVGSYTMDMVNESIARQIAGFARLSLEAMGRHVVMPNGVVHLEVFRRASGELLFLEAQLRPPGANAKQLYALLYKNDLEATHLKLQMGRTIDPPRAIGPYAAWIYFPTRDGIVSASRSVPALRSLIVHCDWRVEVGQTIKRPCSILDALGRGSVALSMVISNYDYLQLRDDFFALSRFDPLIVS